MIINNRQNTIYIPNNQNSGPSEGQKFEARLSAEADKYSRDPKDQTHFRNGARWAYEDQNSDEPSALGFFMVIGFLSIAIFGLGSAFVGTERGYSSPNYACAKTKGAQINLFYRLPCEAAKYLAEPTND